jgi:hypothetical protein
MSTRNQVSSTGTDVPTTLIIWIIFLIGLEKVERGQEKDFDLGLLLILFLSLFTVTIKLSALPILLLPVYFSIRAWKGYRGKSALLASTLTVLSLAPWIARNIILSGYLVFPFPEIDLFHVAWKMPAAYVRSAGEWITSWARIPGRYPSEVLPMPYQAWVPIWFQSRDGYDRQLVYIMSIGGTLLLMKTAVMALVKRTLTHELRYLPIYLTALIGLLFWFVQAPDFRFGYGFICILAGLVVAPFGKWVLEHTGFFARPLVYLGLIVLFLYQLTAIYKSGNIGLARDNTILPLDYQEAEVVSNSVGGFSVWVPVDSDRCWYTSLPCTPYPDPAVRMRTHNLSGGFYSTINP